MRKKVTSIILAVVVLVAVIVAGYLIYKKFIASADVESSVVTDLNGDNQTNAQDLNVLLKAIENKSENPKFDLNGDGKVDSSDADTLLKSWSSSTPTE